MEQGSSETVALRVQAVSMLPARNFISDLYKLTGARLIEILDT